MRTKTFQNWLLIVAAIALFFTSHIKAQVTIGSENAPKPFSILELTTQKKDGGLRLPQLTTEERDTVRTKFDESPETALAAEGLVIFNKTTNCLEFWNGKDWVSLCANAKFDPSTFPPGEGTMAGRTCFDIAYSNSGGVCGSVEGRTWKADFTTPANTQVYTFTALAPVSNVRFAYVESSSGAGKIVKSLTANDDYSGDNLSGPFSATLVYKESLNSDARGLGSANALTVAIYAIYNDSPDGKGTDKAVELTAFIKDCNCCGAMTVSGEWLNFMCHNLGADYTIDPFTWDNSKGDTDGSDVKGDLYQWGRNTDGHEKRNSPDTDGPLPGPVAGEFIVDRRGGSFLNWLEPKNDLLWSETVRTDNDPCPSGWKVPTDEQWMSIFRSQVFTDDDFDKNPDHATANQWIWTGNGFKIGSESKGFLLYLPAAGTRSGNASTGVSNVGLTGQMGFYWSSSTWTNPALSYTLSEEDNKSSFYLYFEYDENNSRYRSVSDDYYCRSCGNSVRCVEDK